MDVDQFDHLSRVVARATSRRVALGGAAALGLAAVQADARKKTKNACKGGCGPCQVCKKKGKKKTCVTAPDGAACDGGSCRAGTCCLSNCPSLGNVCGPISDQCGGTVTCTCGASGTPACDGGRCATCATTCPDECSACVTRVDGTTKCGANVVASCPDPCSSDVDCPPSAPFCAISRTTRLTGETVDLAFICGRSAPAFCATITAC